jgi:hypothetical protein
MISFMQLGSWVEFRRSAWIKRATYSAQNMYFDLALYHRALGASIGSNVCLYPHGADPMVGYIWIELELVAFGF